MLLNMRSKRVWQRFSRCTNDLSGNGWYEKELKITYIFSGV